MSENTVKMTINGVEVSCPPGDTILKAAKSAGIEIPTLCRHEGLADFGACRLCLVEIKKGQGRSRLVVSCLYPAEDGLEVATESEKVVKHRRMILEFLRARWPNIRPDLVAKYDVPEGRLAESGNFCVMCGICVRVCHERQHADVLGFVGRGTQRQVVVHSKLARERCPECSRAGAPCIEACPTGVLVNDFALLPSHLMPTTAGAEPVRMRDEDNRRAVQKLLGAKS